MTETSILVLPNLVSQLPNPHSWAALKSGQIEDVITTSKELMLKHPIDRNLSRVQRCANITSTLGCWVAGVFRRGGGQVQVTKTVFHFSKETKKCFQKSPKLIFQILSHFGASRSREGGGIFQQLHKASQPLQKKRGRGHKKGVNHLHKTSPKNA